MKYLILSSLVTSLFSFCTIHNKIDSKGDNLNYHFETREGVFKVEFSLAGDSLYLLENATFYSLLDTFQTGYLTPLIEEKENLDMLFKKNNLSEY